MADATAATAIGESSEVELEAKRKADGSWHPCQVSLCSGGGLSVKFEGGISDNIILDVEDAFVCLRVRSVPLQGDDCCYIEEGKHILAACEENYQRLFFDAVVQKVIRVRHSKRASCRCTFMIKWLDHAENGISRIPSSSIMKLATESINSHPVIAAFLNSMNRSYLFPSSSSPTAFGDTEKEFDLHGLLKHIEGIGSLTDASNKELFKDTLLGVDHGARDGRTKLIASEQVANSVEVNSGRNQLRRSERKQDMVQPIVEDLITSVPSPNEKSVQNQSPLSPLAARAVLASLVSKLPQKIECVLHEERKHVSALDSPTSVHISGGSCTQLVNKVESPVTNERRLSVKKLQAQRLNGLPTKGSIKIKPSIESCGISSSSMRNELSTFTTLARRLTRSATKGESAYTNQDDETTSVEDATFVRVTRSTANKDKGNMAENASEELQDKKIRSTRSTCSTKEKETEVSDVEDKNGTLDEVAKCTILSSTTRVTRSTARAGTGFAGVKEPLQAKPEIESAPADYSNFGQQSIISAQKRTFPQFNSNLRLAEGTKKQKGLNASEMRQKAPAEDLHDDIDTQSQKKIISSKNQPLKSSPRLRFSPRIRSHNKF